MAGVLVLVVIAGEGRAGEGRAAADEPSDPVAIAREVLADEAFQEKLVEPTERDGIELGTGFGDAFGVLGRIVLFGGLAVALVLIGLWLARALRERAAREGPSQEMAPDPVETPWENASLESAERLAAAGRYAEAVHELLLLAVARLATASDQSPPAALTSRELVRVLAPAPPTRAPFQTLVRAVELSRFGGRPLTAADWHTCRSAAHTLATEPGLTATHCSDTGSRQTDSYNSPGSGEREADGRGGP